jgi:signal transduction histidine kinase
MADLCVVMKDYDCALKYYQRVISDWNIKPTSINIIKVHRNIGKVYALLKQYKTAEDYLLKALEMTKKSSRVENKVMVLLSLVELYKEQEFYKEALYYLEKHEYILDSSLVAIGQQEMNRMDAIYQLEKEEQSYRFEEEKKVFRNRIYSYSIIVLLVILLIYLLGQYRSKRKANKALMVEKEKAQESDRLKSAFLANMSHEIRTPMNAILGFTDLLRDPELTQDELSNYVDVIEDGGQRMLTIINDLVDISKIEAGIIDISYSKIEVNTQIESVGYLLHNEALARGLELIITKNKEALVMNTDQEKLQAILLNLVKNAMKFTPSGSVEVGYCCHDNEVNFFVKDTGVGIAEDKKEVIFERFVQAEKHKLTEGTGLGLSISKAYVEMLGGRIGFSSEIDKGSTFYFTIPRNM